MSCDVHELQEITVCILVMSGVMPLNKGLRVLANNLLTISPMGTNDHNPINFAYWCACILELDDENGCEGRRAIRGDSGDFILEDDIPDASASALVIFWDPGVN